MQQRLYTPEQNLSFFGAVCDTVRSWYVHRDLAWAMVKRDVMLRYRGSFLGLLWSFLSPLLLLAVYSVVFGIFFQQEWPLPDDRKVAFTLMLFCGIVPFNFFSEVISKAPLLIVNSPNYVKRIAFPVQLLPMVAVGSALLHTAISSLLLLAAISVWTGGLPLTALWYPVVWIPLILSTLALALLVAALGVFLRDLVHLVGFGLSVLFFMTPIVYPETFVTSGFRFILWVNPIAYAVSNIRKTCILGLPINLDTWLAFTALSIVALFLIAGWFPRLRRRFADVL